MGWAAFREKKLPFGLENRSVVGGGDGLRQDLKCVKWVAGLGWLPNRLSLFPVVDTHTSFLFEQRRKRGNKAVAVSVELANTTSPMNDSESGIRTGKAMWISKTTPTVKSAHAAKARVVLLAVADFD